MLDVVARFPNKYWAAISNHLVLLALFKFRLRLGGWLMRRVAPRGDGSRDIMQRLSDESSDVVDALISDQVTAVSPEAPIAGSWTWPVSSARKVRLQLVPK